MNRFARVLAVSVLCAVGNSARGQIAVYNGVDIVASPSVATAADALASEANWINDASALGQIHTVDFESLPLNVPGITHTIAPGVTITAIGTGSDPSSLENRSGPMLPHYSLINGFNTTSGGSNHMRYTQTAGFPFQPGVMLHFSQPIAALSMFLTGGQEVSALLDHGFTSIRENGFNLIAGFGDGGFPFPPSHAQPNVRFGGFIDQTNSYTSIGIHFRFQSSWRETEPSFSLDDIRWVYAPTVPEPTTFASLLVLLVLGACQRSNCNPRS